MVDTSQRKEVRFLGNDTMSSNVRKSCYVFEHRITFLGAEKVGKSAIINQFIKKEFMEQYAPTSEHHLTYVVEHKGNMCVCLFVDTAGSDDFPAMRKLSLAKGNIFVVVYSIDNPKSFTRAKMFVDEIKSVKGDCPDVKIMFVGNKVDLESSRQVPYADGYIYAKELNNCENITADFAEVTATDQDSVIEVLYKLLAMFKMPSLVEVPILQEKKMLSKLRKKRKTRKERKLLEEENTNKTKTNTLNIKPPTKNSSSDSELLEGSVTPKLSEKTSSSCHELQVKNDSQKWRKRADSHPVVRTQEHQRLSSPCDFSTKRRGSFSPNGSKTDISSPTLISHSLSLRKCILQKPLHESGTDSKSSSDDSGVSGDDSNSQGEPSPKLPTKFLGPRRTSLSEKMKGMFKKVKLPSESSLY